ncbi:MAG: PQQ-binding-like beta-propeller repeat protein [Phycisphaerae bacterium]
MKRSILLSVLTILVASGLLPADGMTGYRGDTTGVFTDGPVPAQGKVLWKAPLPNWGFGFPIVVDGKVFCMSEPGWKHTFPVLTCHSAADGKLLWELELDHLAATGLPKDTQDAMRTEMARRWAWWRKAWADGKGRSPKEQRLKPDWQQRGYKGLPLEQHGLYAGTWWDWGMTLIGHAFPTPVSDGEHVYVVTGRGTQACITMDGKVKWLNRSDYDLFRGEDCKNARSPVLWKNLLIASNGTAVRAYDKATGQEVWRVETDAGHTVATPVFITLGETEFIYTCVNTFIRLRDGKKMTLKGGIGEGVHTPAVNDEHDIIYFSGNGEHCSFTHSHKGKGLKMPVAVKFRLEGEAIKGEILWQGDRDNKPPLYHDGRLYCGNTIYDALTGKVLKAGSRTERVVPATRHVLLTDGRHIFGVDARYDKRKKAGEPGVVQAFTLDGKPAGRVELPYTPDPGRCRAKMGGADWGFSNSCPFILHQGRAYIRGFDSIYCVGE